MCPGRDCALTDNAPSGDAIVVWSTGPGAIYARWSRKATGWQAAQRIDAANGPLGERPSVGVDASGNAVVWDGARTLLGTDVGDGVGYARRISALGISTASSPTKMAISKGISRKRDVMMPTP